MSRGGRLISLSPPRAAHGQLQIEQHREAAPAHGQFQIKRHREAAPPVHGQLQLERLKRRERRHVVLFDEAIFRQAWLNWTGRGRIGAAPAALPDPDPASRLRRRL